MIDFNAVVAGAKFKLIREDKGWSSYYDPETMGGEYGLVAETDKYVIFLGKNGYQIQDHDTLDVYFFDFDGNEI